MNQQVTIPSVYNEFQGKLATLEQENRSLVFDYEDKKDNKAARSHIAKLRKSKTVINSIHKETKAEALALCKSLDEAKNVLIGRVEDMINVHLDPIKEIEARIEAEQIAKAREEQRIAEAKAMAARKELDHEAAILEDERRTFEKEKAQAELQRQAQNRADNEAAEKIANEKAARIRAENEKAQAEQRAIDAEKNAQAQAQAQIKAAEEHRLALEAEEKAIADAKAANLEHRRRIHQEVFSSIKNQSLLTDDQIKEVVILLAKGKVMHAQINY